MKQQCKEEKVSLTMSHETLGPNGFQQQGKLESNSRILGTRLPATNDRPPLKARKRKTYHDGIDEEIYHHSVKKIGMSQQQYEKLGYALKDQMFDATDSNIIIMDRPPDEKNRVSIESLISIKNCNTTHCTNAIIIGNNSRPIVDQTNEQQNEYLQYDHHNSTTCNRLKTTSTSVVLRTFCAPDKKIIVKKCVNNNNSLLSKISSLRLYSLQLVFYLTCVMFLLLIRCPGEYMLTQVTFSVRDTKFSIIN